MRCKRSGASSTGRQASKPKDPAKVAEAKDRLEAIGCELKHLQTAISDREAIIVKEPKLDQRIKEITPRDREERAR